MASSSGVEAAKALLEKSGELEDPWLISYADLVTNLLAFMVLLVSMAGVSFESMDALPGVFGRKDFTRAPLQVLSREIEALAESEGLTGEVVADVDQAGLAIQLQDRILFPSGVATLSAEGRKLVDQIARLLVKLPDRYKVIVEGHTDDVPISTPRFPSNWDLSAGRALEVRAELSGAGVSEERLSISAFADTRPIGADDPLDVGELRRRSRRVVIRVYY